jgi:hypothetical protein
MYRVTAAGCAHWDRGPNMNLMEALTRRISQNRRRHSRRRFVYDVILTNNRRKVLFRGKTADLSRTGARLRGLPVSAGVLLGQKVRVGFLFIPKDLEKTEQRLETDAHVWRIEERQDSFAVAIRFVRPLDE